MPPAVGWQFGGLWLKNCEGMSYASNEIPECHPAGWHSDVHFMCYAGSVNPANHNFLQSFDIPPACGKVFR